MLDVDDIAIDDPQLAPPQAEIFRYWAAKRGDRAMPARRDLDPLEMKAGLGRLNILAWDLEAGDWRFRLHGSIIVFKSDLDMTGRLVRDHPDADHAAFVRAALDRVRAISAPLYTFRTRVVLAQPWRFTLLFLPLSSDGTVVDMVLTCLDIKPKIAGEVA
jgi:hypothetical protein